MSLRVTNTQKGCWTQTLPWPHHPSPGMTLLSNVRLLSSFGIVTFNHNNKNKKQPNCKVNNSPAVRTPPEQRTRGPGRQRSLQHQQYSEEPTAQSQMTWIGATISFSDYKNRNFYKLRIILWSGGLTVHLKNMLCKTKPRAMALQTISPSSQLPWPSQHISKLPPLLKRECKYSTPCNINNFSFSNLSYPQLAAGTNTCRSASSQLTCHSSADTRLLDGQWRWT